MTSLHTSTILDATSTEAWTRGDRSGTATAERRSTPPSASPCGWRSSTSLVLGDASPGELPREVRRGHESAGLPPARARRRRHRPPGPFRRRRPPPVRAAPPRRPARRLTRPVPTDGRTASRLARTGPGQARLRLHRQLRPLPARRRRLAPGQPDPRLIRRDPPAPTCAPRERYASRAARPRPDAAPTQRLADVQVQAADEVTSEQLVRCGLRQRPRGTHRLVSESSGQRPHRARWLHWHVPDPVRAGTDEAFETAYDQITERVDRLAAALDADTPRVLNVARPRSDRSPTWQEPVMTDTTTRRSAASFLGDPAPGAGRRPARRRPCTSSTTSASYFGDETIERFLHTSFDQFAEPATMSTVPAADGRAVRPAAAARPGQGRGPARRRQAHRAVPLRAQRRPLADGHGLLRAPRR